MQKYKDYFNGKKVTVMGLGLLGRGVGDIAFLAECGAELIVTDLKSEKELQTSLDEIKSFSDITYRLGEHSKEDFEERDMVLVAAGVPMDSPYLLHAKEKGVPFAMSGALFAELSGIPIVGVTGTRGKSTVTYMIHHILQVATGEPVILGGNIRGVSNLQLLKEVHEGSLAVMELDSWQLQGFGWAKISPQVAVFTSFMEDHLDYYKGDMDAYFADKANIFRYQEGDGIFVTTPEVFEWVSSFTEKTGEELQSEALLVDSSVLPDDCLLSMLGEHNRLNAAFAYKALEAMSLEEELIFEGLATFPGVPGRLEYLRDVNGVRIFNDNNATTPAATLAGLKSLARDGEKIILIMGGTDKGIGTDTLISAIPDHCKKVVLLPGTGTDRFLKETEDTSVNRDIFIPVDSLEDAIKEALTDAKSGDTVLFSPGFASFGPFKNEYDRNDQFVDIINAL